MLRNQTSATLECPVAVTVFSASRIDAGGQDDGSRHAEFEVHGRVVACRRMIHREELRLARALLTHPVLLHLEVGEDRDGNISGLLSALVPDRSDPLCERIAPNPFPLGAVFRPNWRRLHPRDLGAEAKSILHAMAQVDVTEASERAVENLLRSL